MREYLLVPYVNMVGKNATFATTVVVGMVKVMKHVMFAEVIMKKCSRCIGNYLKVCQVCKGKKEPCTACKGTGKKPGTEYVDDKWLK